MIKKLDISPPAHLANFYCNMYDYNIVYVYIPMSIGDGRKE